MPVFYNETLCYLHIPKCGGLSVTEAARAAEVYHMATPDHGKNIANCGRTRHMPNKSGRYR